MTTVPTFKSGVLRPIDLARAVGLSAQAVRNYEDDGILPPALRSASGYRQYTYLHLSALEAFLALARAASHSSARDIMRAVNSDRLDDALEVVDTVHSQLLKDRQTVRTIQSSLAAIESEAPVKPSRISAFTIGDLAHRLGVGGSRQASSRQPARRVQGTVTTQVKMSETPSSPTYSDEEGTDSAASRRSSERSETQEAPPPWEKLPPYGTHD